MSGYSHNHHPVCDMDNLSIVIPVFNEDHGTIYNLQEELELLGAEVIIVDDGSDVPYPYATVSHPKNLGYGQSLMTGISKASRSIILTMDGDSQHIPQDVKNLCSVWKMLDVDMIIGARRLTYEEPLRMFGRKALNLISCLFTGIFPNDLNSGMRIFKRDIAMGYFPILCKTFSFTTSITMSYLADGHKVEWFPIKVSKRKYGKSHVNIIKDGWTTLKYIIWIGFALRTRRIRAWLRSLR